MSRFVLNAATRRRAAELAVATCVTLLPSLAEAHFNLQAPPNWTTETMQGSPQKDWPCGNEGDPTATGPTTPYKPGDKVTINLAETVTHPGYYRVALATSGDMMDLPADMSRTASGDTCEHDDMQAAPVFPILADGMLEHTEKLNGVQSFNVTLPSDVTCDKCVLQVREYMQGHSSAPETATQTNGCYYHHCAFISITATTGGGGMSGGGAPNGGAPSTGSGGTSGTSSTGGVSMGGAMGEAGRLSSAGGAGGVPGTAGTPSSGHGGAGAAGMPGTGGVVSSTAGAGGTSTNTGAAGASVTGTGGSGGALGSSSGGTHSAPTTPSTNSRDEGGCAVSPHGRSLPFGFAGVLGLGMWLARRRR